MIAATAAPTVLWYLTRGSGIVTLVLLTAAVCLGVTSSLGWRSRALPRFVVSGLHRSMALLALVFLAIHVVTTVADSYTSIGISNAFVPFVAGYRPFWLGLGALACDLLLAVVITSLVRVRLGYRAWRGVHWLAYAAWPLALVHGLGTGSDARFGWIAAITAFCTLAVAAAIVVRVVARGPSFARLLAPVALALGALGLAVWYRTGPAAPGWAARAGTPTRLLAAPAIRSDPAAPAAATVAPPARFAAVLSGQLRQSGPDANGLVTVQVDARLSGGVHGELRLALQGEPSEGGIVLTASGVAFALAGTSPVYEGSVAALDGSNVVADVNNATGTGLRLQIVLQIEPGSSTVSGSLQGVRTT